MNGSLYRVGRSPDDIVFLVQEEAAREKLDAAPTYPIYPLTTFDLKSRKYVSWIEPITLGIGLDPETSNMIIAYRDNEIPYHVDAAIRSLEDLRSRKPHPRVLVSDSFPSRGVISRFLVPIAAYRNEIMRTERKHFPSHEVMKEVRCQANDLLGMAAELLMNWSRVSNTQIVSEESIDQLQQAYHRIVIDLVEMRDCYKQGSQLSAPA